MALAALGIAGGAKLVALSIDTLILKGSSSPFGEDDLGLIGVGGLIVISVFIDAIVETFNKRSQGSNPQK